MSETVQTRILFVPGEITTREHCFDRYEPFAKHPANPVIRADRPWEGPGVYYPTVLYSEPEKLYKMWYFSDLPNQQAQDNQPKIDGAAIQWRTFLCYAVSTDGLKWEKPNLGKVEFRGRRDNNIVLTDSGFFMGTSTVVFDPDDPNPARRYKLLYYDNDRTRDGVRTAVSPDGVNWQPVGDFPVLPTQDTPSLWYDRRRKRFVAFLKDRFDNRRARMISTSDDFIHWSEPAICFIPDQADSPTLHFYAQSAFHHCGHDFGLLNRFEFNTQKLDLELVIAPQGNDWRRLPGRPVVLTPGNTGAWDQGMILNGHGEPIICGDTAWYYYYGASGRHDEHTAHGAIGIATFSVGRLVGQQFEDDGWFASKPFRCPGGSLAIDTIAREPITVEVCSTGYGGPIEHYRKDDCRPVQGDNKNHKITWKTKANLDEFHRKFIILRIHGKNAVVYGAAFQTQ